MGEAAHALKGSCSNMGAMRMAFIAEQLQNQGKQGSLDGATDMIKALESEFVRVKDALDAYATAREHVR
jgi:HPt (histidine-containing phosphotransfer) domain-containing protein